jgi:hypothetical protein
MKDLKRSNIFILSSNLEIEVQIQISTWSSKGNRNQIYKCQTNMKLGTTMNMGVEGKKPITFEECVVNPLIIMVVNLTII